MIKELQNIVFIFDLIAFVGLLVFFFCLGPDFCLQL